MSIFSLQIVYILGEITEYHSYSDQKYIKLGGHTLEHFCEI